VQRCTGRRPIETDNAAPDKEVHHQVTLAGLYIMSAREKELVTRLLLEAGSSHAQEAYQLVRL